MLSDRGKGRLMELQARINPNEDLQEAIGYGEKYIERGKACWWS
jgi:hypothetical protein